MASTVDTSALKVNQACIVGLSLLAFVLGSNYGGPWLTAAVGLVLALGTLKPEAALFKLIYSRLLKPRGWVKPHVVLDDPQSHLFAQGLGACCLLLGSAALLLGATAFGWSIVWLVISLATINLVFGFCVGCFLYYQLGRFGLLGGR